MGSLNAAQTHDDEEKNRFFCQEKRENERKNGRLTIYRFNNGKTMVVWQRNGNEKQTEEMR